MISVRANCPIPMCCIKRDGSCEYVIVCRIGCLTPHSAIRKLYRGGQFYWWRKTTNCQTLSHNIVSSPQRLSGIRTHNVPIICITLVTMNGQVV